MRRRPSIKLDANQNEIVDALRSIGATVQSLAGVGNGCPDLLVALRGQTFLLEVKDSAKPPSARRLTPAELAWHQRWNGGPLAVVESVAEALLTVAPWFR